MITRIDSTNTKPSFQSSIVLNENLYKALNYAKVNSRAWDYRTPRTHKLTIDNFVKSVEHILNDGKKDVYEIKSGNPAYKPTNSSYLTKNGKDIHQHSSEESLTDSIMNLVIEYASRMSKNIATHTQKARTPEQISEAIDKILGDKHFGDKL